MRDGYDLGMTFTVDVGESTGTYELVHEYMEGFGWRGVRTQDVIAATKCSRPSVLDALGLLVVEGKALLRTEKTRGNGACPRKRWYWNRGMVPVAYEDLTPVSDAYFEGTTDELVF